MKQSIKMVVQPSPILLPASGISRNPPRPEKMRQDNYSELFDDKTLFYDAVASDGGVTLIGPPLLNLQKIVTEGRFTGSHGQAFEVVLLNLDRTSVVRLVSESAVSSHVSISSAALDVSAVVSPNMQYAFAGKKVLVTKSKDNKLEWIRDWVKFHVAEQGIDAVLIYDNGSTSYGPEDVLNAVSVDGVDTAIVVNWPFKFGPQGGNWNGLKDAPWDSDFCEYGILEHARRRFLEQALGVLSADVDELVMTDSKKTVFDLLDAYDAPVLSYKGRWIEAATTEDMVYGSHSDYIFTDPRRAATTDKWVLKPSKIPGAIQWKTHWIPGVDMTKTSEVVHRHFMGINSNWKWERTTRDKVGEHLIVDDELHKAFKRVFPERF